MSKASRQSTRPSIKAIIVHPPHMDPDTVVVYEVKNGRVPAKGRQKSRRLDELIETSYQNKQPHSPVQTEPDKDMWTVMGLCPDANMSIHELSYDFQNSTSLDGWGFEHMSQ